MDDRTLLTFGRVAVAAGNIEVGSYFLVWALEYGNFARTDALVAGRQFRQIADLGRGLADATWPGPESVPKAYAKFLQLPERPPIHRDTIAWIDCAKRFMDQRNKVLHSGAIDEVGLNRFRPGRGHIRVVVEELEGLADEGEGLVTASVELIERIRYSLPKRDPVYRDLTEVLADRSDGPAAR